MLPAIIVAVAIIGFVVWYLARSRKRNAERLEKAAGTAPAAGLSIAKEIFDSSTAHRAPLASFHVEGEQARVTFDVPMPEEDDDVFNDLLMAEAVEVVRERRHTLPIDDVNEIVVFAGQDEPKLVGRTKLPSTGELPPPEVMAGLSLSHVAHDPFAAPFEERSDHSVVYDTKLDVPADELPPLRDELKIPKGLERGLRATGVNPDDMTGPEFVLSLLRMFGYGVTEQAQPDSYIAVKDGQSVYILTEAHGRGGHPELDESVIRRFLVDFQSSGADRGILISDKYSPFMIHEIEGNQPKVRFITRERVQSFVDSMALG